MELKRGGQIQQVELLIGFKTNVARPSAADSVAVKIHRLEVRPVHITPGAPFEVGMDYMVTEPAARAGTVAVEFGYRIVEGQKVLFTQPAARLEVPNGIARRRTEQLTASPRKGRFTFQASLRYGQSVAEQSVEFQIE